MRSVAADLGVNPETLRNWVRVAGASRPRGRRAEGRPSRPRRWRLRTQLCGRRSGRRITKPSSRIAHDSPAPVGVGRRIRSVTGPGELPGAAIRPAVLLHLMHHQAGRHLVGISP
ncbi:hypothetical protein ACFY0G_10490 [Streptomyces sp. NPDC001552]|uniref:hypothetical protein n=1 Tax=Streptomyces sp. NPDC001552 TaxID=3364587 RepID=UPI00369A9A86